MRIFIFRLQVLCQIYGCKYFLPVCGLFFPSFHRIFLRANILNSDEIRSIIFLRVPGFWCHPKSLCLTIGPEDILLFIFGKSFGVLCLKFQF